MTVVDDAITAQDVADHIEALSRELAAMARQARLGEVAVFLEAAQRAARRRIQDANAAPEDAA